MNILEPILFQARCRPGAPALCAAGHDIISYARLRTQMNNVAHRAINCGLKPGAVVALSIDRPLLHAVIILGLTQAGIIPVSVAMQKPPPGLTLDAVISSTDYPHVPEVRRIPLDFSWITGNSVPVALSTVGAGASEQVCCIILTAGSTGDAKAVALSHHLVMARNARFDHVFGNRVPLLSRFYLHMGLAAALGYQFLIGILSRGGTVFFRGDTIEATLQSFELFQIEAMLATPATLGRFVAHCDRFPSTAVHLDTILSGGSLLPLSLVERVRPRLCTNLITGYGSTETAITATAPADAIAAIQGAAGFVLPGITIQIVDEADRPVPSGTDGVVRIASEFAVDRYIDDSAESARVFRNGWFYPGDLGSLTEDGLLIISGRQNTVLNAGGDKMPAERVEAALTSFQGVREAAVCMATNKLGIDEIWAAVVTDEAIDIDRLRAHCRTQMPLPFVPERIINVDTLPTNALGKLDRSRLRQMLDVQQD